MSSILKVFMVSSVTLLAAITHGQDTTSLGDVARQARQQKQSAQAKTEQLSKAPKVITNEEIPAHPQPAGEPSAGSNEGYTASPSASTGSKMPAEQWKSQIQAQKNAIGSMESEIKKLNDSIQFAPGNCVAGCVQWNERQQAKQQEVERAQAQLAGQKKRLEDMQESARHQGYGSSVYDP
jgi:hypothetical protein